MGSLDGKIAVVTGASSGIGEATARRLAGAGARVFLAARREDRLAALAAELGGGCGYLALDLAQPEAPAALLADVTARFGTPDIVVHNAGVLHVGTVDEFDLANLQPMIALNYESVVRGSHLFARAMKAAGRGDIINISSIGANIVSPGTGIYGGLKKALEMYTDALRIELAGTGVRVGLVAPGMTSTEIFEPMKAAGKEGWDTYIPALEPDDIARAILFMLEQPRRAKTARIHVYSGHEGY
ncbi:NADP-dependent 3-hydroxy acid dehydrogenase YdfG [Sphingobium fontiphilum]|uniref:NADP-dependent 3-hydroxy acid dehydrogenase YdfG n=1 Tax=Sphingobium fontiphilum TaxID=944425 RepID=A0A7W6DHE6_9SPHN|nr:SDR family oxidoreductase [Sphingobium fontiphilum]MBB3982807.1 NADP-dependent 3-hydroxy acid dehydrogenase YdfG [Sphingobium fontiphilum]